MGKVESWQLQQRQGLPLEVKVGMTQNRIRSYYEHFNGDVAVSFSGGKDSTVLLHIARGMYPDIKAVFVDTGLEYPEIRSFVKSNENIIITKPKIRFDTVIEKYGYPIISKDISQKIYEIRTTKSEKLLDLRLHGGRKHNSFALSKKWAYLIDAPFKISDKCCYHLKKSPMHTYNKKYAPIVGITADESFRRKNMYLAKGCTSFEGIGRSWPIAFWKEQDILQYLKQNSIEIASVYGNIIETDLFGEQLKVTGVPRTGCVFCAFGVHLESSPNRFQKLAITHPKLWEYCIFKLGFGDVLKHIGVPYECE